MPSTKSQRLNARIPAAQARQMEELVSTTGQTTSDVLRSAISHYYKTLPGGGACARDALLAVGFISCGDADSGLSSTYKDELSRGLTDKHGHR